MREILGGDDTRSPGVDHARANFGKSQGPGGCTCPDWSMIYAANRAPLQLDCPAAVGPRMDNDRLLQGSFDFPCPGHLTLVRNDLLQLCHAHAQA